MQLIAETPQAERLYVGRDTAAQLLDVSTRMIDDAIRAGELQAWRIGRRVLISRDALIQFAERERHGVD
jgi:excisionase family DNA binding protein